MSEYLNLGEIVNTHGIKGEVRVQSLTDKADERYQAGAELVIHLDSNKKEKVTVESHRKHKQFDLLTFEEFDSINEVEDFKSKLLQIEREKLPEPEKGQFYESDLIDLKVVDENREEIGRFKEVLFLPANDVWIVSRPDQKDLLLPVIESVIKKVDLEAEEIVVNLIEGLD
ncbi:MAG: ribosome maturation factor RimM [Atopostipes sp.]|nr:ribosome maturation factor RimM [Atopostipes sp.]